MRSAQRQPQRRCNDSQRHIRSLSRGNCALLLRPRSDPRVQTAGLHTDSQQHSLPGLRDRTETAITAGTTPSVPPPTGTVPGRLGHSLELSRRPDQASRLGQAFLIGVGRDPISYPLVSFRRADPA
jgi:hypothetical protein